jgi:hypothetical protein
MIEFPRQMQGEKFAAFKERERASTWPTRRPKSAALMKSSTN